jgi:succinyl-CoA synthetase beta subunit
MNLHEYQAKELLKANGIKVPKSQISNSVDETFKIAKQFNSSLAVKAQIHAGGRGKAGGIKMVSTPQEAKEFASIVIGKNLITEQNKPHGQPVNQLLIEKTISIKKEMYFSILIDRQSESIVVITSQSGGMDIEEIANKEPSSITKEYCKVNIELNVDQINNLAVGLGIEKKLFNEFRKFLIKCFKLFKNSDLSLLEINPLVISDDDEIVAVDCKISLDDNARFRHTEISEAYDWLQIDKKESEAFHSGLSYIALEGNIGCMVNGAGLAMATMDLIKLSGGLPANFLDVGGGATAKTVSNAFKILLSDKNVEVVLVNIFGGIMRCDIIAEGIISAVKDVGVKIPIVVRLEGTNVILGKEILKKSDLNIISADSLTDAAIRSVNLTTLKK